MSQTPRSEASESSVIVWAASGQGVVLWQQPFWSVVWARLRGSAPDFRWDRVATSFDLYVLRQAPKQLERWSMQLEPAPELAGWKLRRVRWDAMPEEQLIDVPHNVLDLQEHPPKTAGVTSCFCAEDDNGLQVPILDLRDCSASSPAYRGFDQESLGRSMCIHLPAQPQYLRL